MRILVTLGATKEPIDNVRYITNFSTGRFGSLVASCFAAGGHEVVALHGEDSPAVEGCRNVPFRSHRDLAEKMRGLVESYRPDVIVHSAAVSDYTLAPTAGKIPSDRQQLVLVLERTPKILDTITDGIVDRTREWGTIETFVVGFKLVSGTGRDELIRLGQAQLARSRSNLCVGNVLEEIRGGRHPILVMTPEGGLVPFDGTKEESARFLADFVTRRFSVRWFHTEHEEKDAQADESTRRRIDAVLSLLRDMRFLQGGSGNLSLRSRGGILVSPRRLERTEVRAADYVLVQSLQGTTLRCRGPHKSAMDSGVHWRLYEAFSGLEGLLHCHHGYVLPQAATRFCYPCGVVEEAQEILRVLGALDASEGFSVELADHGYMVGFPAGFETLLQTTLAEALEDFSIASGSLGLADCDPGRICPILTHQGFVGVVYEDRDGLVLRLVERQRGRGMGSHMVSMLQKEWERRGELVVKTVPDPQVLHFYEKNGFHEVERVRGMVWLRSRSEVRDTR